jgi:D-alanyl-D-alanine carboxypeptidase
VANLFTQFMLISTLLGAATANNTQTNITPDKQPHTTFIKPTLPTIGKDTLLPKAYVHCDSSKYAMCVMDAKTGDVIVSYNAHKPLYPASVTKMLPTLEACKKLSNGEWQLDTPLEGVRPYSNTIGLTMLGIKTGQQVSVKDALLGTFIKSGADAAQTLTKKLAGNKNIADYMNEKANELGMCNTYFTNASGDYDHAYGFKKNAQKSTAYDMALLLREIAQQDSVYTQLLSAPEAAFGKTKRGKLRTYKNHALNYGLAANNITFGKTGNLDASGKNIAVYSKKDNLAIVVFGAYSGWDRAQHVLEAINSAKEIRNATRQYDKIYPLKPIGLDRANNYKPQLNRLAINGLQWRSPNPVVPKHYNALKVF